MASLPQNFHLNKALYDLSQKKQADAEAAAKAAPPPTPEKPTRVRLQEAIRQLLEENVSKAEILDVCLAQLR
jgi:hypothetical protein